MTIETIEFKIGKYKEQLESKKSALENLESEIDDFELDPDEYAGDFETSINEGYECSNGEIIIAGVTFDPAYILKNCDPTAYRVGLADHVDNLSKDIDPDYREMEEKKEELLGIIEEIEIEIGNLEEQLEDLEEEE